MVVEGEVEELEGSRGVAQGFGLFFAQENILAHGNAFERKRTKANAF